MSEAPAEASSNTELAVVAPIPVATFEGALVTSHEGKIPGLSLEMSDGYPRGTHLRIQMDVRIRSVRMDEARNGDLVRVHVFAIEEVHLQGAYSSAEAAAASAVGGSASAQASEPMVEVGGEIMTQRQYDAARAPLVEELDQVRWLHGTVGL